MPYLIPIVLVVAILLIFFELIWISRKRGEENQQLKRKIQDLDLYYKHLYNDNETLRSYMDNSHTVWHEGDIVTFLKSSPSATDVMLIRSQDLRRELSNQWIDGHDNAAAKLGKTMQMALGPDNQPDQEGVVTIRASFADKKFDHDFAMFVNELTKAGIDYGQTQQLRERISHIVISFRQKLAEKQRGKPTR